MVFAVVAAGRYTSCMATRPKRPRDPIALAKLIGDIATGQAADVDPDAGKDPAAVALGRRGGLKGGKARAAKLSAERLSEIGKQGALAKAKAKTTARPEASDEPPERPKKIPRPILSVPED